MRTTETHTRLKRLYPAPHSDNRWNGDDMEFQDIAEPKAVKKLVKNPWFIGAVVVVGVAALIMQARRQPETVPHDDLSSVRGFNMGDYGSASIPPVYEIIVPGGEEAIIQTEELRRIGDAVELIAKTRPPEVPATPTRPAASTIRVTVPSVHANQADVIRRMTAATGFRWHANADGTVGTTATPASLARIRQTTPFRLFYPGSNMPAPKG